MEKNLVAVEMANGKTEYIPFNQKRLYELATISRKITVFMSLGILVAVFLTGRKLFNDAAAGILSALCLALSCHFMFYSESACVDIPAFFWFAWAGCFGLYAIKSNNLFFYMSAGFCAAWSVCTKEGVAMFYVGLALALAILLIRNKMSAGMKFGNAMKSLLNWQILAAVVLAILVFVTLEGMWGGLDEWHHRSQSWQGVVKDEFKSQDFGIGKLLQLSGNGLAEGWGVPFTILLLMSLGYWIVKYRWQLCLTALPFLSFFFLTTCVIGTTFPRFMMCGYAGIAIIIGKTLANWYRFRRIPLLVPSFICCVCFNLEMNNDTRVRTEEWMRTSAKSGAIVGLSMKKQYAPRVWLDKFRSIPRWDSKGVLTRQSKVKIWPDYIIGSDHWPGLSITDQEFFNKVFKGETEYEKQAEFGKIYFKRDRYIWKYCLRFFRLHPRISPRVMI